MAWLGKISNLGNLSDFAGAVNKLSESVKNIERNFDSALGLSEPSEAPIPAPAPAIDKQEQPTESLPVSVLPAHDVADNGSSEGGPSLLNNVSGVATSKSGCSDDVESKPSQPAVGEELLSGTQKELQESSGIGTGVKPGPLTVSPKEIEVTGKEIQDGQDSVQESPKESSGANESSKAEALQQSQVSAVLERDDELVHEAGGDEQSSSVSAELVNGREPDTATQGEQEAVKGQSQESARPAHEGDDQKEVATMSPKQSIIEHSNPEAHVSENGDRSIHSPRVEQPPEKAVKEKYVIEDEKEEESVDSSVSGLDGITVGSNSVSDESLVNSAVSQRPNGISGSQEHLQSIAEPSGPQALESAKESEQLSKLKSDLKMMEAALNGAAKQSQTKADEISKLMIENEELRSLVEELKSKTSTMELDALREEYQQRVGAAERKVYALTKERDMLRREQNRKSDSSMLLKEKDEIIKQVMAEGEELSKKQAVQEGTMRKLRAQIRELEEEKQRLNSRVQVEEGKVENIRKDKAVTETALQEAVEKGQAELASLREYYTTALNEAKESEARAEARADSEAKADLERRFRESADRETAFLQNLDDLRQALSQTEQQKAFREDMHRRELEDLEKRCQAAEARYEELVANMPDSTRPLRRQIEALQESTAMRAEAWTGVERSLNSQLQEAEAKAATAQERERAVTDRLSQTLSRVAVMEAQLSMLRAEQSQLTRSLEKERQRASESRQEYLATTELATTLEGRAKQLEEEFEDMRIRQKQELKEERARRHALEQELDHEKAVTADHEKRLRAEGRSVMEKGAGSANPGVQTELISSHKAHRRLHSVSSAGSVDENFMQASTDSDSTLPPRLSFSDRPPSPYIRGPSATLEQLELHLRQKEGELNSCFQRLASLESTRDSLAEELVSASTQCEALRAEAAFLPGLRAELDSLRRRHTSALELMGERDEEVEELRADLADIKQMYREQITMLVGQIERLSAAVADR